jgi:hypothetical protein
VHMGEGVQMWEREGMQERVCKGRQRQREGASEGGERECLQERAPEGGRGRGGVKMHRRGCTRWERGRLCVRLGEGASACRRGCAGRERQGVREGEGAKMCRRGCMRKGEGETGHEVRGGSECTWQRVCRKGEGEAGCECHVHMQLTLGHSFSFLYSPYPPLSPSCFTYLCL